jgi:hypothetical protein
MALFARPCDGEAVYAARARQRQPPPTAAQWRSTRNLFWLSMLEGKVPDPIGGRPRRFTPREIAALWGLTKQAVLNGLRDALRARAAILAVRVGRARLITQAGP